MHKYEFPAIRGIQAGREYFVSMCPVRLIPKIFQFDEEEISAELRAQRTLNRSRVPEMSRYILDNPKSYVFSALTASIDGEVEFVPFDSESETKDLGRIRIPMTAKFLINDGQHRRAAIAEALKENPAIGDETIAVVFFKDIGLEQSQQMFADLNRYAIRATPSIGILYDHRDERTKLTKQVVKNTPTFNRLTEFERNSLAPRSSKLFTLSSIHGATKHFLAGQERPFDEMQSLAIEFWGQVCLNMPDWLQVSDKKVSAGEVRQESISCHSVALAAIGFMGQTLIDVYPKNWQNKLKKLSKVDWSKRNTSVWEGRALLSGQVSKTRAAVTLTTSYLKQQLELPLTPEEDRLEQSLKESRDQ